jgi:hypothetical protein
MAQDWVTEFDFTQGSQGWAVGRLDPTDQGGSFGANGWSATPGNGGLIITITKKLPNVRLKSVMLDFTISNAVEPENNFWVVTANQTLSQFGFPLGNSTPVFTFPAPVEANQLWIALGNGKGTASQLTLHAVNYIAEAPGETDNPGEEECMVGAAGRPGL